MIRKMVGMTRQFGNRSFVFRYPHLSTLQRSFIPFSRDPFRGK